MKIGIIGDIHWSQYSSIVRGRGKKYSLRLENLIKSLNWAESLFVKNNCDKIVQVGDFFDRADINAEELSALKDVTFCAIPHVMIVGNHELGSNDLIYNSAEALGLGAYTVYHDSTCVEFDDCSICFLPYVLESYRSDIESYLSSEFINSKKNKIIFSHNDIKDFQMGAFLSKFGFSVDEIKHSCDLYINGHLHNGGKVADGVINIGNLTGQNFSEDAFKYDHCVFILDTSTLHIDVYENPFAFNFYKLDATDFPVDFLQLKSNAVITLKCNSESVETYRELIAGLSDSIIESRIIVNYKEISDDKKDTQVDLSVDRLEEFKKFIKNTVGEDALVMEELEEVCK